MPVAHNFREFMGNINQRLENWDKRKQDIAKGICIQSLADLQQESPVDFGRYRAAHTLTIMAPSAYVPSPPTSAERSGHAQGSKLARYEYEAQKQIQDADAKLGSMKIRHGTKIFITNNVDYAIFIENGSYTRHPGAPRAVYATVAARYNRILKEQIRKARPL